MDGRRLRRRAVLLVERLVRVDLREHEAGLMRHFSGLGREWRDVFPPGYAGPTHLVRPTLAANRRAHPDVVDEVLRSGWGTQCTRRPDGTLGAECKVH